MSSPSLITHQVYYNHGDPDDIARRLEIIPGKIGILMQGKLLLKVPTDRDALANVVTVTFSALADDKALRNAGIFIKEFDEKEAQLEGYAYLLMDIRPNDSRDGFDKAALFDALQRHGLTSGVRAWGKESSVAAPPRASSRSV